MVLNVFGTEVEIYLRSLRYVRLELIENYESFIWTERFREYGDFQLKIPAEGTRTDLYYPGGFIELSLSRRIMVIENTRTYFTSEGTEMLEVSGRSFEHLFKHRVVTTTRKFQGNSPGWVATRLVREICAEDSADSSADQIPDLVTHTPDDSTFQTDVAVRSMYLYDAVKELCDSDNLGFRVRFIAENNQNFLIFKVTRGVDRTSRSTDDREPVIFSTELDNLNSATYVRSSEEHKTIAYVWHDDRSGPQVVGIPGEGSQQGIQRKVLSVDANDIEDPTSSELAQRGREALSQHRYKEWVDGESDYVRAFIYDRHYFLGDMVEVWYPNKDRVKSRVIEHIWSFDSSGIKAYPTLEYVEHL